MDNPELILAPLTLLPPFRIRPESQLIIRMKKKKVSIHISRDQERAKIKSRNPPTQITASMAKTRSQLADSVTLEIHAL